MVLGSDHDVICITAMSDTSRKRPKLQTLTDWDKFWECLRNSSATEEIENIEDWRADIIISHKEATVHSCAVNHALSEAMGQISTEIEAAKEKGLKRRMKSITKVARNYAATYANKTEKISVRHSKTL